MMIKRLATYFILFFLVLGVQAQDVRFTMSAPNAVENGKQFRLSFTLNQRGSKLQLPPGLNDNFQILMGPSTGTSYQNINGRSSTTYSYTYILRATKEGTFEIRPASIEVDGEIVESNSLKIQVVKANSQPSQPQSGGQTQQGGSASNVDLGKDNLFVRVELSNRNPYRGEQIIATVKLYANPEIPITNFADVNLPTYEGFYTQDIEIPGQINMTREVYNDKIYQVGVLKKTILFPQQNGTLRIEPFSMALLVRQRTQARSFFDDFFDNYRTVKAPITSDPVTVNVKDLPPAPANFLGGVGNFNITSEISGEDVTTNDAVTLTVKISGNGNIRLIRTPELKLPSDFEVYDPKATDNVKAGNNGASGSKTIEYLFQPRFEGDYTIPAIPFTYFNPATGQYVTKSTPAYSLHVEKGTEEQSATVVSSLRKQDVQLIGQDIRYIKQGSPSLKSRGSSFFGSTLFYLVYILSALLFVVLYIVYRKKARENANIALMRNKKANRVAIKRLKSAAAFMKQNNNEAFHEAILKAFEGYLSDKLAIPVADLKRETAVARLQSKNVSEEVIADFVDVVEQCEFARYAPTGGSEARHELYKKAESTMGRMEKQIKR
ncbi:BatD family protein [Maribellus sediminis]|uniref:BatD family protein n=1 Tax=Maribellus sediminis TaxID=2696285 RepID=UPI001430647A|nr:BatD family protein [Maribellus sediminis]